MTPTTRYLSLAAAALLGATPALAQQQVATADTTRDTTKTAVVTPVAPDTTTAEAAPSLMKMIGIQNLRPTDQRGVNVFESPKHDAVPFTGFRAEFGAAFTQQVQALKHENTAINPVTTGTNPNQLMEIGTGFNNAVANAYLNAQLAPGIRVAMTSYLSARHHNESWVKDGYLLIDASPIKWQPLELLMDFVTVKAGHFEINYGDTHFRRTDNGNSMYNAFVGNTLLDAFTTEIGAEVYVRLGGAFAMVSGLGGESRGMVTKPQDRSIAWVSKVGFDQKISTNTRFRLTGSTFNQPSSTNNTLFAGDRAGSRYYQVLENTLATESANSNSGTVNPGFSDKLQAFSVNPFIKWKGVEFFGDYTKAQGRTQAESANRDATQQLAELVYRFGPTEKFFAGARYNTVDADLRLTRPVLGTTPTGIEILKTTTKRNALSAGWFLTPTIMMKGEYVRQQYDKYPTWDIRNGGKFNGFVLEGAVGF